MNKQTGVEQMSKAGTKHTITGFSISWQADHEQYWQGHGICGPGSEEYTYTATGCGETLREAFEDALGQLEEQGINTEVPATETVKGECAQTAYDLDMLAELTSQVKEPDMLDWDIVKAECPVQGKHDGPCPYCSVDLETSDIGALAGHNPDCECNGTGINPFEYDDDPDCAICAGEWHYYVNVDVKVKSTEERA